MFKFAYHLLIPQRQLLNTYDDLAEAQYQDQHMFWEQLFKLLIIGAILPIFLVITFIVVVVKLVTGSITHGVDFYQKYRPLTEEERFIADVKAKSNDPRVLEAAARKRRQNQIQQRQAQERANAQAYYGRLNSNAQRKQQQKASDDRYAEKQRQENENWARKEQRDAHDRAAYQAKQNNQKLADLNAYQEREAAKKTAYYQSQKH